MSNSSTNSVTVETVKDKVKPYLDTLRLVMDWDADKTTRAQSPVLVAARFRACTECRRCDASAFSAISVKEQNHNKVGHACCAALKMCCS